MIQDMNDSPQTQSIRLADHSATPHIIPFHRAAPPAEQRRFCPEGKAATNIPTLCHGRSLGDLSSLGRLVLSTPIDRNVVRSNGLDHLEPEREGSAFDAALVGRMPVLSKLHNRKHHIALGSASPLQWKQCPYEATIHSC